MTQISNIKPAQNGKLKFQMSPELLKFAQEEANKVLLQMEINKSAPTLHLGWPQIKQGFFSGFVNGVNTGFNIGYKTANKLAEKKQEPEPSEPKVTANADQVEPSPQLEMPL